MLPINNGQMNSLNNKKHAQPLQTQYMFVLKTCTDKLICQNSAEVAQRLFQFCYCKEIKTL